MQIRESGQCSDANRGLAPPGWPRQQAWTDHWHPNGAILLLPTGLVLAGPQSRFAGMRDRHDAVLVRALRPAHWSGWLEVNARAHADRIVPLPAAIAVPAGEVARFAQRLADGDEAVPAIGNWLDEAIARAGCGQDSALAEEVGTWLDDPDIRTAQILRKRAGISQRQLAGLCDRNFGFTPNLLLRRARFLRSFAAIEHLPWGQWTGAIDPAYFDQSHFIRDCHRFLGMTPSRFLAEQAESELARNASSAA